MSKVDLDRGERRSRTIGTALKVARARGLRGPDALDFAMRAVQDKGLLGSDDPLRVESEVWYLAIPRSRTRLRLGRRPT